ncbi:hypothetical protein [Solimonas sp. SE-A11]|uniref:hypothetical protein n=1 Tax=Solimonas sp. SE-A11 TaxID=3054954 RepID=UPI00259CDF75|nr:hypothetical protein [Solimonas sp. SE-A11]MDM4772963.1 hypothetical protein [Solimonas sp. SE-A11]
MKLRFNQVLSASLALPLSVATLAFASNADREYTSGDLTIVERTVNGAYAGIDEDVTLVLVRADGDRLL